ncbi:MAG: serine/threonine-protein kinase, partial [Patescibacteria group bacterium]|nr:serine/threonine-protein kinase [Patescibacteria group bacterium]
HEQGWMHGDVKPANIMISPAGHATLLDLGFAKRRSEDASAAARAVMGTCNYLAPEVLSSRIRADIRSDLYSLGVILFEALAGRLPFVARTMPELISQHQTLPPPDLKRLAPQTPDAVADLVRRLLAKEPLRRPQTPAELVEQLVELEIATFSERALA